MRSCCVLFAVMLTAGGVLGGEAIPRDDEGGLLAVTAMWENDSPYFKPNDSSDRYYTNGVAIDIAFTADWAQTFMDAMPSFEGIDTWPHTTAGVQVGQLMFTPENLRNPNRITGDRPYAGYLFAGAHLQRASNAATTAVPTLDVFQLEIGVVGDASEAEAAQDAVHELFDDVDPQGWDNQVGDEVTVQFYYRKKWRFDLITAESNDWGVQFQAIPAVGGALGSVYRHLEAGAVFRLGWNLPDDFGPARIADVAFNGGLPRAGWSISAYGRLTGRLVDHNLFLAGGEFSDNAHGVARQPLVGEGQFGFDLCYHSASWTFALTYGQTFVTAEFDRQDSHHAYGLWGLMVERRF